MELPFTAEQFGEVFRKYNTSVWPLQVIFYLLAAITIFFLFKQSGSSSKLISGILGFFWIWMGVVYHLIFFAGINKAAYIFGILFIMQGILFIHMGVFKNLLAFKVNREFRSLVGIGFLVFALIAYPILGFYQNHIYPSSPTFGLPCPTTIFTFGILLLTEKKISIRIVIIPFIWSIIGFTASFNLGMKEDISLLVTALIAAVLIPVRWKFQPIL